MKNIHILPTDKPSRLFYLASNLHLEQGQLISPKNYQNIYITSDEEIKEGDWILDIELNRIEKCLYSGTFRNWKKIILTTDQSLDGVQSIDDEFLEWFVKNPSCKNVEVSMENYYASGALQPNLWQYKIIIPKKEPKQEIITSKKDAEVFFNEILNSSEPNDKLKKAAEEYSSISFSGRQDLYNGFIEGAKWQQERMEEILRKAYFDRTDDIDVDGYWISDPEKDLEMLIEQFKKQ